MRKCFNYVSLLAFVMLAVVGLIGCTPSRNSLGGRVEVSNIRLSAPFELGKPVDILFDAVVFSDGLTVPADTTVTLQAYIETINLPNEKAVIFAPKQQIEYKYDIDIHPDKTPSINGMRLKSDIRTVRFGELNGFSFPICVPRAGIPGFDIGVGSTSPYYGLPGYAISGGHHVFINTYTNNLLIDINREWTLYPNPTPEPEVVECPIIN